MADAKTTSLPSSSPGGAPAPAAKPKRKMSAESLANLKRGKEAKKAAAAKAEPTSAQPAASKPAPKAAQGLNFFNWFQS